MAEPGLRIVPKVALRCFAPKPSASSDPKYFLNPKSADTPGSAGFPAGIDGFYIESKKYHKQISTFPLA
jgi:hypothetical protein